MSEQIIIAILGSSSITALITTIITTITNIRMTRNTQIKRLEQSERILMKDRIKHLARAYINRGWVTTEELEDLHEMHNCYHDLGGNGFLDTIMGNVNRLAIKDE